MNEYKNAIDIQDLARAPISMQSHYGQIMNPRRWAPLTYAVSVLKSSIADCES